MRFLGGIEINNKYNIIDDKTAEIIVVRRNGDVYKILVDIDTLEWLKTLNLSWHVTYMPCNQCWYAQATEYLGIINGKPAYKTYYLSKLILKADYNKRECVDHKNHNTLDNRKDNLRIGVIKKNTKNRKSKNSNNKSGYRNVSWNKSRNKWVVQLIIDGKNSVVGLFDDVHEAGAFAKKKREELYGSFKGKD